MVSAADAFERVVQPLVEGDGSQALVGTRPVYFDGRFHDTRLYDRDLLQPGDTFAGPAIVSEYSSATVLPPGDVLRVDGLGNLLVEVHA
jgi:N-methylhydantoinase A